MFDPAQIKAKQPGKTKRMRMATASTGLKVGRKIEGVEKGIRKRLSKGVSKLKRGLTGKTGGGRVSRKTKRVRRKTKRVARKTKRKTRKTKNKVRKNTIKKQRTNRKRR